MGNWAPGMAEAASVISDAGADIVDVNLGCPTKRALKGTSGQRCFVTHSSFRCVVGDAGGGTGDLSAKIRAGFDDAKNVVHIAQTVERAGADFIVVHPRSRRDHYKRCGRLAHCRLLKQELLIPLLAMVTVGTRRMLLAS